MSGTARYRVVHETRYDYSSVVTSAHQLAHLSPRATPWQRVVSHRLDIDPDPPERDSGRDYFGNDIVRFSLDMPHETLTARAESMVEVDPHAPAASAKPLWESALAMQNKDAEVDLDIEQYRVASPAVPLLAASRHYAEPSFAKGRPWVEAVLELAKRIRRDFAYD